MEVKIKFTFFRIVQWGCQWGTGCARIDGSRFAVGSALGGWAPHSNSSQFGPFIQVGPEQVMPGLGGAGLGEVHDAFGDYAERDGGVGH